MSDNNTTGQMPEEVEFAIRIRTLLKMGVTLDDPRMALAVQNLGIWPQLLFDIRKDVDGKYMMEVKIDEVARILDYNLSLATVPEAAELEDRASKMVAWCQQLLGEDWAVHVSNRKSKKGKYKMVHKGERVKPLEASAPTLSDAPFPEAVTKFNRYRTDKKSFGFDEDMDLGPIVPARR
jgi:hypothetical protein